MSEGIFGYWLPAGMEKKKDKERNENKGDTKRHKITDGLCHSLRPCDVADRVML